MQKGERLTAAIIRQRLEEKTPALLPTQPTLCVPIINRIFQKMVAGLRFDDIKVCDGLVIDRHHRYVASVISQRELGSVPTHRTSATKARSWNEVNFVDEEWDTPEKIDRLNREDAAFNNVSLDEIKKLTD